MVAVVVVRRWVLRVWRRGRQSRRLFLEPLERSP
jgi:hypothetical protein